MNCFHFINEAVNFSRVWYNNNMSRCLWIGFPTCHISDQAPYFSLRPMCLRKLFHPYHDILVFYLCFSLCFSLTDIARHVRSLRHSPSVPTCQPVAQSGGGQSLTAWHCPVLQTRSERLSRRQKVQKAFFHFAKSFRHQDRVSDKNLILAHDARSAMFYKLIFYRINKDKFSEKVFCYNKWRYLKWK